MDQLTARVLKLNLSADNSVTSPDPFAMHYKNRLSPTRQFFNLPTYATKRKSTKLVTIMQDK